MYFPLQLKISSITVWIAPVQSTFQYQLSLSISSIKTTASAVRMFQPRDHQSEDHVVIHAAYPKGEYVRTSTACVRVAQSHCLRLVTLPKRRFSSPWSPISSLQQSRCFPTTCELGGMCVLLFFAVRTGLYDTIFGFI